MFSWNYRIIRKKAQKDNDYEYYELHEVHYSADGVTIENWTVNPIAPHGETLDELNSDMKLMLQAFERPVLDLKVVDGEEMLVEIDKEKTLTPLRHGGDVMAVPPRGEEKALKITCTVTKDGRISLPKAWREKFNIEPGDEIQWIDFDGGLVLLLPPINKRPKAYRKLYKLALSVFEGSEEAATSWLHMPQFGLNNARPIDHMKTAKGANDVLDLLGRMEYGLV